MTTALFNTQASSFHRLKRSPLYKSLCALLCIGSFASTAAAQTSAPAPTQADQTIELPEFTIHEEKANPYQSQQALSTSRVAMSIQDIPQTISVVPSEFIQDSMSFRMLDAAKYITPVVESTLPFGSDRYMIRGFQVSHEFIDGTEISGADGYSMSLAPYNIERVEVIKGPNAILVPGGSPGGQMNPITKSPSFTGNRTTLNLDLAEYIGNDVWVDTNRVLNSKGTMAARLVAAYWRNDAYIKNMYRNGYMIAPSFSMRLSPTETFTLKAEFVQNRETNLGGLPIDPSIGSNQEARIARGLPRDWSFGNEMDSRHRSTQRVSGELLSVFGDHLTSRLYVMGDHVQRYDVGGTNAALASAGGGSRNPLTGLYEPGVNWNTAAYNAGTANTLVGTPAPVTDPSTWMYTRNVGRVFLEYTEGHIKNDYALRFAKPQWYTSTTIAGFAANTSKVHYKSSPPASRPSVPANDLDSITYPDYVYPPILPGLTTANKGIDRTARQNDLQLFAYETLAVWEDRIQVSGGVSRYFGELTRTDTTGTALDPVLLTSVPSYNLSDTATNFGVTVKPIKPVSLFFSRNTTGGTMPGSLSAGTNPESLRVAQGSQKEFGAKTSLLNNSLTASFAYFDIVQQNYPVPNSDYYTLVAQGKFAEAAALQNPLYLNLNSKGWEFEMTYSFNKNLTILGNYTSFKVRQPITDVRLRGVPDHAGAIYVDYQFTDGVLKGWGANIGVDYKSDVAGENATGYTTSRPLPDGSFVAAQPSFIVEGRTLVNAGISYRHENWSARLQAANVLDKDYILAAGSRTSLIVGEPRSFKLSVSYSFK
ncbi:MAG TPA: TonB-dependent receptor plug domain-containing protein [Opitutaceae bacterium]|nr:TonB-dependent receptor plug domain-containing protein [Opitutaceae bacterium]